MCLSGFTEALEKMADKVDVAVICKFNGQNYPQWKFHMKCALKAKGLYGIVDGSVLQPTSDRPEELSQWIKRDAQAMFTLTSGMDLSQITLVESCESSKEMLDKLDSIFVQKSETNKMLVHERFHQYKMISNDSIAQHIAKVENLAKMVRESGETISDAAIMTKILSTLPIKYRNVRQAWLSMDETKQTIPNLTARLLDEESSLTSFEGSDLAMSTVTQKFNKMKFNSNKRGSNTKTAYPTSNLGPMCYNCRKRGHIARNCRFKSQDHGKSDSNEKNGRRSDNSAASKRNENLLTFSESAFTTGFPSSISDEDVWIMDSGASAHMTYRRDILVNFEVTDSSVVLSDNKTLEVKGKGTVRIKKLLNGCWENATINNVLYIPELKKKLVFRRCSDQEGNAGSKDW